MMSVFTKEVLHNFHDIISNNIIIILQLDNRVSD